MSILDVDIERLIGLRDAIGANLKQGLASVEAFQSQAMSLLDRFINRLDELEHIREQKAVALNRCEMRRSHNENVSCATEERAYDVACEKCLQCENLINQARTAIAEFDSYADSYRQAISDLSSRSETGLARIEAIIQEYITSN